MIDTNDRRQQRPPLNDAPSRLSSRASSTRRRHRASISDAVIAAYLHELRHAYAPKRAADAGSYGHPMPGAEHDAAIMLDAYLDAAKRA